MNSFNNGKGNEEKKQDNTNNQDLKTENGFDIALGDYLEKHDSVANLLTLLKNKLNNDKSLTKIEIIILKLVLKINPLSVSIFKDKDKKVLMVSLIKYLYDIKKEKSEVNAAQVYEIFKNNCAKIPLIKNLFVEDERLKGKEISYLELVTPFIPESQINSVIKVLMNEYKFNEKNVVKEIIENLQLNCDSSFKFLKELLLIIINYKDDNICTKIANLENAYIQDEKNELLFCNICSNLPFFFSDEKDGKIKIKYTCDHIKDDDISNPERIKHYKKICSCCNEEKLDIYKHIICSNCKKLICNKCKLNHSKTCLPLFFIPLSDICFTCPNHKEKYEFLCTLCETNLCNKCKEEHCHYTNYLLNELNGEEIKKIKNILNSDKMTNNIILDCLKKIISNNKYLNIPHIRFFFEKLLNKNIKIQCGLFEEFENDKFIKYYSKLIKEIQNGNLYYINIYNQLSKFYKKNGKEIIKHNMDHMDIYFLFSNSQNTNKVYAQNMSKFSLLNSYYAKLKDINVEIELQNAKIDIDKIKISQEKSDIKAKALLNINNKYRTHVIKLINRCIADNILRYLIKQYPDNFRKIVMNAKIYSDIYEANIKKNPELIRKIELSNKDKLNNFMNDVALRMDNENNNGNNNVNNNSNENGIQNSNENSIQNSNENSNNENVEEIDTEDTEDNTNLLIFEKPISNLGISVKELNNILKFLFYTKDDGNYAAHPNNINNNIPLNLYDDKSLSEEESKLEFQEFENQFMEALKQWEFKEKLDPKDLFESLFNWKYNLLIKLETKKMNDIKNDEDGENFALEKGIVNEFKILDDLIISFSAFADSLKLYKKNVDDEKHNIFKEFYKRLIQAINSEDSTINILNNILNLDYSNSLIGDNNVFINDCFSYIITNLYNKHNNIISELRNKINKLKKERNQQRITLEMFTKLNQKATKPKKQESFDDERDFYLRGLINFFNKDRVDSEKIEYEEKEVLINSIRKTLEKLVLNPIDWLAFSRGKITSLLYLKQNKLWA